MTRSWGQLLITTRLDDAGNRTYEIRHRTDSETERDHLTVYTDPRAARQLTRFDESGQYRPLKTAPTLPTGWLFTDLDGPDLVRTVEEFYPGTVANWTREREGELDVTHWRATADRQSGLYDVVDELPPAAIEWAVQACCVDSQCLKRREWDVTDSRTVDVPSGDGEFPCREACSLFVAAAREFALAEREDARTDELELTPREKAQLGALVDAVAEGRTSEIRDGNLEDDANRYRVRYLRAKLSDEGRLDSL